MSIGWCARRTCSGGMIGRSAPAAIASAARSVTSGRRSCGDGPGISKGSRRQVDVFIAMSEFSRDKHREFGFPREMEVVPYFLPDPGAGAAARAVEPPHPRPYFLFVGRLERIKGLDDVIPAFERYRAADLLSPAMAITRRALKRLAVGNPRVAFLGRMDAATLEGTTTDMRSRSSSHRSVSKHSGSR